MMRKIDGGNLGMDKIVVVVDDDDPSCHSFPVRNQCIIRADQDIKTSSSDSSRSGRDNSDARHAAAVSRVVP